MKDSEKMSVVIGEVRGNDRLNKLLFRLGTYQNKLVILLKQHGIDSCSHGRVLHIRELLYWSCIWTACFRSPFFSDRFWKWPVVS